MSSVLFRATVLTAVVMVVLPVLADENRLPKPVEDILVNADKIELISLDPASNLEEERPDDFHGYKVLGKTTIKADARKKLAAAVLEGMEGEIDPAACFEPRHGIRASRNGDAVDLVVCFACSTFKVFEEGAEKPQSLLVNSKPEALFNRLLKDAKIPIAK